MNARLIFLPFLLFFYSQVLALAGGELDAETAKLAQAMYLAQQAAQKDGGIGLGTLSSVPSLNEHVPLYQSPIMAGGLHSGFGSLLSGGIGGDRFAHYSFTENLGRCAVGGLYTALVAESAKVCSVGLSKIPALFVGCMRLVRRVADRWYFGADTLCWNDVATMSNYVYQLCAPFLTSPMSNSGMQRRIDLLAADIDGTEKEVDGIVKHTCTELRHIIARLERALICYEQPQRKQHSWLHRVRFSLASYFSCKQQELIMFHIRQTIVYVTELLDLWLHVVTTKELRDKKEELKDILTRVGDSFELVASLVDEDVLADGVPKGYLRFIKPSSQATAALPGLDNLMGGGQLFPAS